MMSESREGKEPKAATARAGEVDGLLNLDDFRDATGLELPAGPYNTVAGYLMARLGRVAVEGDAVVVHARTLTVTSMDARRIARITVGSAVSALRHSDNGAPDEAAIKADSGASSVTATG